MKKLFIPFLYLLSILSCHNKLDPYVVQKNENFAIYLLADAAVPILDVALIPLKDLELADHPFICENDIQLYEWAEQKIILNASGQEQFINLIYNPPTHWGIALIFVVGDEPVYLAEFGGSLSSTRPNIPHVHILEEAESAIQIYPYLDNDPNDPRYDPKIFGALRDAGLLGK